MFLLPATERPIRADLPKQWDLVEELDWHSCLPALHLPSSWPAFISCHGLEHLLQDFPSRQPGSGNDQLRPDVQRGKLLCQPDRQFHGRLYLRRVTDVIFYQGSISWDKVEWEYRALVAQCCKPSRGLVLDRWTASMLMIRCNSWSQNRDRLHRGLLYSHFTRAQINRR